MCKFADCSMCNIHTLLFETLNCASKQWTCLDALWISSVQDYMPEINGFSFNGSLISGSVLKAKNR